MPADTPPPPPAPAHALDQAISMFWDDFVRRQAGAGRRDLARMLEVALEFFFERSTQLAPPEARRRAQLEQLIVAVRAELGRLEPLHAGAVGRDGRGTGALPAPYVGVELTLAELGPQPPPPSAADVVSRQLPPIAEVQALSAYREQLTQQLAAAEAALAEIIQRMVSTRAVVAERLKVLSPQLYAHGAAVIAQRGDDGGQATPDGAGQAPAFDSGAAREAVAAAAAAAAAASVAAPVRAGPLPWWRSTLAVWGDHLAVLMAQLRALFARARALRPGQLRQAGVDAVRRDRELEETLAAFERKVQEWDR